jgi:hypothetical protein
MPGPHHLERSHYNRVWALSKQIAMPFWRRTRNDTCAVLARLAKPAEAISVGVGGLPRPSGEELPMTRTDSRTPIPALEPNLKVHGSQSAQCRIRRSTR